MEGRSRACYALGCTARHMVGEGKLFRIPQDPVRAQTWAERVGRKCTREEAVFLHHKYLCRDHFLPTDFTTSEGIRLNRTAVPHGSEFVDALKTSIINGLAYADLCNANCEGDDTELLDNLHSFLIGSCASRPNSSTNDGSEPLLDGVGGSYIAEPVQQYVSDFNSDLFSVAYVSGFIAKQVLRAVRCDDCKAGLTSSVVSPTHTFIYFQECRDDKQSLTYPSERLVKTVSDSVTVLESKMVEVALTDSVEEKITAEIKKTVDFGWIQSDCCSLVHGIVHSVTRKAIPCWCKRTNRSHIEASRNRAIRRKMKILSHT